MNNDKIFELFINALVLFTALPVHECAHAWVAHKMGDDTAKNQGRITLNPFKHLSLWGSIMMVLIGFGWGKPVNVNPNNFKNHLAGRPCLQLYYGVPCNDSVQDNVRLGICPLR